MTYTPYPRHRNLVRGRSPDFLEIIGISRISLSTHDSSSHDSPIHHPVVPVPVVPVDSLARGREGRGRHTTTTRKPTVMFAATTQTTILRTVRIAR